MKSWKRKLLLTVALVSFFIVAPTLVFYAIGYRYDFTNKAFRKIGMIIVESEPKDADIFIDNKYKSKTPLRIKNLLPGEYRIKVSKDNFNSWEKNLSVESKKVTWASNIKLFYNQPITNTISEIQFEDFNLSPNFEKVIAFSKQQGKEGLYLINLETEETKKILDFNNQDILLDVTINQNINLVDTKWSPDNKKIIISENKEKIKNFMVINSEESTSSFSLNNFYDLDVKKIEWKNDNEIYLLDKSKNLHQISLASKLESDITLNNVVDFDYDKDRGLIHLKEDQNNIKLLGENNDVENPIMNLNKSEEYRVELGNNKNIAVLSVSKNKLYLVNQESKNVSILGENINQFKWSREKNKLVYFNNNEVWFYVPEEEKSSLNKLIYNYNEPNLLTRYSEDIKDVNWYPNEEYLSILFKNSLKIIELDGRDKRNCYEIKNEFEEKNKKIEFDKKGEKIYYLDNKNNNFTETIITED